MTLLDSADIELGVVVEPMPYFVDPDEVVAYSLTVAEDDPRYLDGAATPPSYSVVPASPSVRAMPTYQPNVLAAMRGLVHGEHDVTFHRPIVPGTWVHTSVERTGVVPSRAGLSVEQVVRTVDEDGELLAEHHWVPMLIGASTGEARGEQPPDHSFPDAARARPVGRAATPTTRDLTFRYAGASSDRSPIHVSDEAAKAEGFPRKFNQGLCTFGIAARMLADLLADGDATRLARLAVRFSAPAFPGDDIEVEVFEIGGGSYAFEASAGGQVVLRHGRAELRPSGG
jgi:acyl dehydratase